MAEKKAKRSRPYDSAYATACSVLIDRLDVCFARSIEPALETRLKMLVSAAWSRDEIDTREQVKGFVLSAFQEIQLALFPEAFMVDPECEQIKNSLIPSSLEISRTGLDRLLQDVLCETN